MTARGQPACAGYVQAVDGSRDDPERAIWTVKALTGPQEHVGKSFHIKRGQVPAWIRVGKDVMFDVDSRLAEPAAINVRRTSTTAQDVPQAGQGEHR